MSLKAITYWQKYLVPATKLVVGCASVLYPVAMNQVISLFTGVEPYNFPVKSWTRGPGPGVATTNAVKAHKDKMCSNVSAKKSS